MITQRRRRDTTSRAHAELNRRIAHATAEFRQARCQLERAHLAVIDAEDVLLARRLEWEEAALRVAELADLVEVLRRDVGGPA